MSSSNSLGRLVFSTRKCSLTEGGKDWTLLPLNECNFLKSPCMPLGTTDRSVRGEITSPARSTAWLFDSQFISQDGYQMPLASLRQLLEYIQRFLHGLTLLYFYISYHAELKKGKINIWTMKTQQMPNKWQYLTCNQSVIFKPKLPKMI